ncbi:hypothetical protein EOD39_9879 [Acipenser ruthenus]|uniref:Uncharacterized protein n=1 Tax=Acipenser ruthenus TaxID=7906 RepID=A0A662YU73_ACIRT|nr:hypothetical protein EOD39_9879 [Acipenser ruthenus]
MGSVPLNQAASGNAPHQCISASPRITTERPASRPREELIKDLQEQICKLAALLADEQKAHRLSCKTLTREAEEITLKMLQQHQHNIRELQEAHNAQIDTLRATLKRTSESEKISAEERYGTDQELEELQKEKEERREQSEKQFEKQIAELMKEYQKRIQALNESRENTETTVVTDTSVPGNTAEELKRISEMDNRYQNRIHGLMNENADLGRRFFLKCEELLEERSKAKRETLARELKAKENINSELQGQTGQGEEPKDTSQDKARLFTVP